MLAFWNADEVTVPGLVASVARVRAAFDVITNLVSVCFVCFHAHSETF